MFAPLWTVLHGQGVIVSSPRFLVFAAYPLIPWVGVAAAGYALAGVFTWPAPRRVAALWRLGSVARPRSSSCARSMFTAIPCRGRANYPRHGPLCHFEHDESTRRRCCSS
jgi:uncharacterized membrane protein